MHNGEGNMNDLFFYNLKCVMTCSVVMYGDVRV
jgi:hypothetical protein